MIENTIGTEEESKDLNTPQAAIQQDDVFENPKHLPVFPTSVFEFTVKESEKLNASLEEALTKIDNPSGLPNWSSLSNLHLNEDFDLLGEHVVKSSERTLDFLTFKYKELALTSLTANIVTQPDRSPPQTYSNNFLSGVYCLKAGGGRIVLSDPRSQAWMVRPSVSEVIVFNSDVFVIELVENTMVVIPSWLQRFTVFPQEQTEENIYFSWTTMLKG